MLKYIYQLLLALIIALSVIGNGMAQGLGERGIKAKTSPITPPFFVERGALQQGGFVIGRIPFTSELQTITDITVNQEIVAVLYRDRQIPIININDARKFFIAFDRDADPNQIITFRLADDTKIPIAIKLQLSDYMVQSITGIKNKFVNPDPAQVARIKSDNGKIIQLRRVSDLDNPASLFDFIWPAEGIISGIYGSQRILNGEPRRPHYGVDIALDIGHPIIAPQSGTILLAEDMFLTGKTMVIDHGMGVQSLFMHLDDFVANQGDEVKQGQLVARSGNTGRTSGPHLHWQVNWYQTKFNPQFLVKNPLKAKN